MKLNVSEYQEFHVNINFCCVFEDVTDKKQDYNGLQSQW